MDERGLGITFGDEVVNLGIGRVVVLSRGDRGNRLILKGEVLDGVSGLDHFFGAVAIKDVRHHALELFAVLNRVIIGVIFGQNLVKDHATEGGVADFTFGEDPDGGLQRNQLLVIGHFGFVNRAERFNLIGFGPRFVVGEVIDP